MMSKKRISGTREWAEKTVNIQSGCSNNCKYCYAKANAIRFKLKTAETWEKEELKTKISIPGGTGVRVMFPSAHDITEEFLPQAIDTMLKILQKGHSLLIVSKPRFKCIGEICKALREFKDRVLFRFTIGSKNNKVLEFWEPNAPLYSERRAALSLAFSEGYQTSVSCEPMLDDNIEDVVEDVLSDVTDAVWIGKMNKSLARVVANTASDISEGLAAVEAVKQVIAWQNDKRIWDIYNKYKDNPKIKWKESIKEIVGIEPPEKVGMDV